MDTLEEIKKDWINQLKEMDCTYFVLKAENLINILDQTELIEFDNILYKYNYSDMKKGYTPNKYFVINRDDVNFAHSAEEFYAVMKKLNKND